ncbi:hypothetical protein RF55_5983 [Lasius niger]|uniref:Reverse transcriptase n=1 Tax=Lasius niger TaxID=67767 RepID=A0A0J7KTW4_LASNI|nr:hypothetical protein RF55_5983 [Lasius niger]
MEGVMEWGSGKRGGIEMKGNKNICKRGFRQEVGKEERALVRLVEKTGWTILNGCTEGDEEGEYTEGRGKSVIDYVLGDEEVRGRVINLEVRDNIDSDHHPVIVRIKVGEGKEVRKRERSFRKWVWSVEGEEEFRKAIGELE